MNDMETTEFTDSASLKHNAVPDHQKNDKAKNEYREGPVARAIEEQTAKLPSDLFLWAGLGSIAIALGLQLSGKKDQANFVGHWAPTFLILGLYNKLVKLQGSDRSDQLS